jgi:hypothetical protein
MWQTPLSTSAPFKETKNGEGLVAQLKGRYIPKPRQICSKNEWHKDTSGCGQLTHFTKLLQSPLGKALPTQNRIGPYLASYVTGTSCTVASVAAGDIIQTQKKIL